MVQTAYTQTVEKCKIDELSLDDEMLAIFGRDCIMIECATYGWMGYIAPGYTGGQWQGYTLSNGGFFMCPVVEDAVAISVESNGYEGVLSSEAAGIVASLFALCTVAQKSERVAEHFHLLREYALDHPEASEIFRAID